MITGRLAQLLVFVAAATMAPSASTNRTQYAHANRAQKDPNRAITQVYDGPGLVCGEAFGLVLAPKERLTRTDPGIDFLTYSIDGAGGRFLLYEGNAPQSHDDEVLTGLSFPSVIAIHDYRSAAEKLRSHIKDRLIVGQQHARLCNKPNAAGD